MATRQWAVTTNGTFDFNNPANWQFGTVPGVFDIAQFDTPASDDRVTGSATIAELLITQGGITLTGSYTMSGAQPTELAIGGSAFTFVLIDYGASISGTGNISVNNSFLDVNGTLSGGSATFTNSQLNINAGSVFDVGTVNLGTGDGINGSLGFSVTNAIQIAGSVSWTGAALVVTGTISGVGSLTVPGFVELDGSNTYSGGTNFSNGVLAVGNANALGTGGVTIAGGGGELLATTTETIPNGLTMSGSFTIAAAHGQTLTTSTTNHWSLSASSGDLITFGAPGQDGTVAWSTPAGSGITGLGYSVLVQAGTLRANDANFFILTNNDQHTTIQSGATLDAAGQSFTVNDLHGGGQISDSGGAATLTVNGGNFSGVIGGPLSLDVTGSLILAGNNTYTGGTTIESGVALTLGAGGTTGSVPGAITANGNLVINRSDAFVVNNVSGTGQLRQFGPGVTTLGTGLNYTGGTVIGAGTLVVNDPAALGTSGLAMVGGELLAGATETIGNQLIMDGGFTIAAAHGQVLTTSTTHPWSLTPANATVTFGAPGQDGTVLWSTPAGSSVTAPSPPNGYTLLVQAGTLRANDSGFGLLPGHDTHTTILPGAILDANGVSFTVNDLEGGGHIGDSGGGATLTIIGGNFGGVIDGPLSLDVFNPLVLSGNNTYTGTTTIDGSGTLTLGGGGTTGSVPGAITDNGTLEFRHSNTLVETGAISGSGNLLQDGAGTTVLTATNTYSGGTYLGGGTLEAQIPGALGSGGVIFLNAVPSRLRIDGTTMPGNAILNFAPGDTIDLANIGAHSWSYSGGVLTLYGGGVTVAQLTLSTPFSHPLFALSGDRIGGTNIVLEPPRPQDLNADNRADLVFQTPNNAFLGALSTGAGFTTPTLWMQQGGSFIPGEAQYADVNNDHRTDLIFQGLDNRFYVSLSTGNAFTTPVQWVQHGGTFLAGQAQYADVNADGRADLIMQSGDNGFYVSLSTGAGFTAPSLWVQHGGSFMAGQAQYADVNGDGRADLIFQGNDDSFYVSLSTGAGFTAPSLWVHHGGSFMAGEAQYADVNGDGRADLIFQSLDNRFFVSTSTGSGFSAPVQWVQHGGSFLAGEAQYADVNGDGMADLIFQGLDNRFFVSTSTGSGFAAPVQWLMHGGTFVAGQAQYADVNGDGKYDLSFQGNDNKEYLSLSSGSGFGAPALVADFSAYGPFQSGTLHV